MFQNISTITVRAGLKGGRPGEFFYWRAPMT